MNSLKEDGQFTSNLETVLCTDKNETAPESTLSIVYSVLHIMVPSLVNLLISEFVYQINVVYISSLNDEKVLAGVGLAISLYCTLPFAVSVGTAGVLETLVG